MKNRKIFKTIGVIALGFLLFSGFGCKSSADKDKEKAPDPVNLVMWGLWDEQEIFQPIISEYRKLYPYVSVEYRKFTFPEYEQAVVSALASGKGPDIWLLHNTWLPRHLEKLSAMPDNVMSAYEFGETFVDVASQDFTDDNKIYGIPLYVDTMALYYNKDLFNTASLPTPPTTWTEFKDYVKALTKENEFGDIEQSGAAIGTARNVNRSVDLMYLLMIQNGTEMTDELNSEATFNNSATTAEGESYQPGLDALLFYTDFANPKKAIYAWNPTRQYSTDAFINENTAMMFNYAYQIEVIDGKAPRLNYGIAPMPQIQGSQKRYDFANYWGYVVSNNSQSKDEAWKFLTYTGKQENIKAYSEATGRPASRRDVLQDQLLDPKLKTFAQQALTAQSWYQADPSAIEGIFSDMIESVALGESEASEALNDAVDRVSVLMR